MFRRPSFETLRNSAALTFSSSTRQTSSCSGLNLFLCGSTSGRGALDRVSARYISGPLL